MPKKSPHVDKPDVARFRSVKCAPFPIHALPPVLREMVCSVADGHGLPVVMPAAIALAMVSAALGKGLRIASGRGRKTMGNLFVLLSAASGSGKSVAMGIMRRPLDIIQVHLKTFTGVHADGNPQQTNPPKGFEGSGGFEGLFSSSEDEKPRQIICSDTTGPALEKLLAENHETILNTSTEAGKLLDEASRANSPLGQVLLKGFSGDPVEVHRLNRKPVILQEPCVSVCWLCQPHRLETFLSSDRLMEDGLLARFCVAHSHAGMVFVNDHETTIPVCVIDSYEAMISSLFDAYGHRTEEGMTVQPDHEAQRIMKSYHNRCANRWHSDSGRLQSCIARWTEQTWKMALVLHAAKHAAESHRFEVDGQTAECAVARQEWFAGQQLELVGGGASKSSDRIERLCGLLREAPGRELTLRSLRNSHGFPRDEVIRLAMSAPSQLELQNRQNPRGGPISSVLVLIESSSIHLSNTTSS